MESSSSIYHVLDNGIPAGTMGSAFKLPKGKGFDNNKFARLQDAVEYAIRYLQWDPENRGKTHYAAGLINNPLAVVFLLEGYIYSSGGDEIKIERYED